MCGEWGEPFNVSKVLWWGIDKELLDSCISELEDNTDLDKTIACKKSLERGHKFDIIDSPRTPTF